MITVFGSLNVDYVFQMDRLPQPGETLLASNLTVLPGGKGEIKPWLRPKPAQGYA